MSMGRSSGSKKGDGWQEDWGLSATSGRPRIDQAPSGEHSQYDRAHEHDPHSDEVQRLNPLGFAGNS